MLIRIKKKQIDQKNRLKIKNSEMLRVYYKFMRLNSINSNNLNSYIKYTSRLSKLPKNSSHNYCYISGRGRGVTRQYKLSRHQIRDKFKYLHGLRNSSW